MPEIQYKVDLPAFTGRNVPIKEIAKAMGKDAQYVRVGMTLYPCGLQLSKWIMKKLTNE